MQTDFVNQMWPHARRVAAATGIDPRLVIAQSALETGWGQHAPGNNYFGVKSHGTAGGNDLSTNEVINGQTVTINDRFRGYTDMGASADDYGQFLLQNPRYGAVLSADGLDAQIAAMGASGYATDPNYAAKLAEIIAGLPQGEGAAIGAATMSALGQTLPGRGLLGQPDTGGVAMHASAQQGGLLTRMSAMNAPGQMARPSFWGNIPGLSDPDRRARLAIGLEGLALNPNQGWMQSLQGGIDTRADDRRMNQTAEWLRGQPGGEQFAAALEAGADAQGVFNAYLQSQQPQPGPDQTAMMQNYEYLLANGLSPDAALAAAGGGGGTTINMPGAAEIGTIPQGYEAYIDPETGQRAMREIPGGPEDTSANAEAAMSNDMNASDTIIAAAEYARNAAAERQVDGVMGSIAAYNPGSTNAEVYRQVNTLKAMAIGSNLQAMRDASPTGGALGSITAPELALLANMSGTLDPKSPNFQRDLDEYERTLLRTVHGRERGEIMFQQTRASVLTPAQTGEMSDEELMQMYGPGQ